MGMEVTEAGTPTCLGTPADLLGLVYGGSNSQAVTAQAITVMDCFVLNSKLFRLRSSEMK